MTVYYYWTLLYKGHRKILYAGNFNIEAYFFGELYRSWSSGECQRSGFWPSSLPIGAPVNLPDFTVTKQRAHTLYTLPIPLFYPRNSFLFRPKKSCLWMTTEPGTDVKHHPAISRSSGRGQPLWLGGPWKSFPLKPSSRRESFTGTRQTRAARS